MNSRKQKKRIAARRRVLFLEKLEQREVLAGNVSAAIRGGGDLFVKGDNQGNDITITQSAPGSVTITGNGTTVNGQPSVTLNNFHDDVIIDLNGGSDKLSFESTVDDLLRLPGGLTIHTEGGNDEINFSDTAVKGHVHIDTGSGNDHINASAGTSAWGLRALSTTTILAGSGNDVVSLADSCFNKTANILMERDDDRLFLSHTKFNKAAILNGGLGYDRLSTIATTFAKRPVIVLFAVRNNAPPPSNNTDPVAVNDTATLAEGATASINVAANDTDSDGTLDLTSVVITQNPTNGSVIVNNNGTVSYTHNGSETTSDSFRYTIEDDDGGVSNTGTVNITITPVNDPPVAVNDTATVAEGGNVSIPVSTNDTDADGTIDATSIVVTQNPANGSVIVNSNGSVTYTHNGSDTTSDSFRYTIKDNTGAVSGTATVAITVTPVNDAPVAVDDTATVAEAGTVSIPVSTNDTDSDGTIDLTSIVVTQNPANGSVTVNSNGTVSYTHNGSETTSDSFRYTIKDNSGAVSGTATVNITVTPVNDSPVAVNDVATFAEGGNGAINVASNDTDADGTIDLTSIVVTQNPANGSVIVNSNGTVSYTHNGSETTSDSFRYTIKDNSGAVSGTATVNITITPVNDAPVASDGTLTTAEDTPTTGTLVATDVDTAPVTYSLVATGSAHGTVTITDPVTGAYSYSPDLNYSGPASFTFKANDGTVDSNTATITITVTPVNDAPVASDGTLTTAEDTPATGTLVATDVDTAPVTYSLVATSSAHGTVTITDPVTGAYSYSPDLNYSGPASFTFKANDGTVDSNTATITITVTPVNDAPVASDGTLTTAEDTPATGTLVATDVDTAPVTYSLVATSSAHGTVTITDLVTGAYSYSPDLNYSGPASFTFKANDGTVDSNTATITITVTPVNDAPVASDGTLTTAEDTPATGTLVATDVDTAPVTYSLVATGSAHGTVTITDPVTGAYSYNPDLNYSGPASFTFKANDGTVDSNTATITITVTPVNDAPVASDGTLTTAEDTPTTGTLVATDVDTAPVTFSLVDTGSAHGTVTITDPVTGAYSYSPDLNYSGPASFTFKANDGTVDSNTATISITVTPVNDAPVASDGTLTTAEDTPTTGTLVATDVDTAPVTYSLVDTSNGHGTVTITDPVTGAYSYSPDLNYSGPASFTFKANDGTVDSNTATISITVTSVNDAPTAVNDEFTINEDGSLILSAPGILGNDTDPEGNPLTASLVDSPLHGTLSLAADGSLTYTPDPNFHGTDGFSYTANDGTTDSAVAAVTINVTSVNDAPVASDGTLTTAEDTPAIGTLVATDVDTAPVTYSLVDTSSAHGTVTITDPVTGAYSYNPDLNYSGPASFTFKANDGTVDSNTATISITVTPVNDAPVASDGTLTTAEDTPATGTLVATDVDTAPVTYSLVDTSNAHGTVTITDPVTGAYSYSPDLNYSGPASFTFKANDGSVDSNTATISITVTPVNDAPVASDGTLTTAEDTPATGTLVATDVDTAPVTYSLVDTSTAHGTVTITDPVTGAYSYSPDLNYSGPASFTFKANDGTLDSNTATISLTVTPVNDAPVAQPGTLTTSVDTPATGTLVATDVDTAPVTYSLVDTSNAHGTVTITDPVTGAYSYSPNSGFTGPASFTFKANDGTVDSNVAAISITVTSIL